MGEPAREACGVVGVYTPGENAARTAFFGLFSLQHRGQESAGIVSSDGYGLYSETGMGHVNEIFTKSRLENLKGKTAIGHTRYSTAGESSLKNAQPIVVSCSQGDVALCHNGNLVNADILRKELFKSDLRHINTSSDSEVLLNIFAHALHKKSNADLTEKDIFKL